MANVFQRSWRITKLSFGVIKQDREMLMFPLLAIVRSVTPLFVVPAMLFQGVRAAGCK